MLLSFILCNFLVRMLKYFLTRFDFFFAHKKLKKNPKSSILMAVGRFFSQQPWLPKTAQNFISVLKILLSNHLCLKSGRAMKWFCVDATSAQYWLYCVVFGPAAYHKTQEKKRKTYSAYFVVLLCNEENNIQIR